MLDKKEAMARLDAIEASIRDMKDEATRLREIIDAPEKVEPWRPKKPTLCWRWDGEARPENCRATIIKEFDGRFYRDLRDVPWQRAQPLTRAEALAMVDEPSRYPWDEAPEWANWAATDHDGDVYWFKERPVIDEDWSHWNNEDGDECERIHRGTEIVPDWRNTLEPRP